MRKIIAETERLILRRYEEDDLEDLYEYLSDSKVVEFEPYKPMTMDEVRGNLDWCISTEEMIAVELKESGKMIGNVYLGKRDFDSLEIGYVFNADFWKKGYAKESCEALITKSFSEGVHRIFAECDPQNLGSTLTLAFDSGIGSRKTFSNDLRTLVASSVVCHSWKSDEKDIR